MSSEGGSGRQEAESVAGGPAAGAPPGAATVSKGSNGEVSSGGGQLYSSPFCCASDDTQTGSDGDVEPVQLPNGQLRVPVCCGEMRGWYYVQRNKVVTASGRELTPTQFEVAGGRELARKWRNSIRVLLPDGGAGKRLGAWLSHHNLDTNSSYKRKREQHAAAAAAAHRLGSRLASASLPGSPLKTQGPQGQGVQGQSQAQLSPTKSLRAEASLPGSPGRCPHCQHCGGAAGAGAGAPGHLRPAMAAAAAGATGPQPRAPLPQPAGFPAPGGLPAAGPAGHCARHAPPSSDLIKRSVEAFLASLPPSAQTAAGRGPAAMRPAVAAAPLAQRSLPLPPAVDSRRLPAGVAPAPAWPQQAVPAALPAGIPVSPPRQPAPAAGPPLGVLSPLSALRSTYHHLSRQAPAAGPLPPQPPAAAVQQQRPVPPPLAQPAMAHGLDFAAVASLMHQELAQQWQQAQQQQQQAEEQWPQGDAAHYLKPNAPPVLQPPKEKRRPPPEPRPRPQQEPQQPPPRWVPPPLQLVHQQPQPRHSGATAAAAAAGRAAVPTTAAAGPPFGPARAAPALPAWEDRAGPAAAPPAEQASPHPGSPLPSLPVSPGFTQLLASAVGGGAGGGEPDTPMHWAAAAGGIAGAAAGSGLAAAAAEGGPGEGDADLEWLLQGGELDLGVLLGQDSPDPPPQQLQQQQGEGGGPAPCAAAAAAAARRWAEELTPLKVMEGAADGGVTPRGEGDAELLAELLRSALPSPADAPGGLPPLPPTSPRQRGPPQAAAAAPPQAPPPGPGSPAVQLWPEGMEGLLEELEGLAEEGLSVPGGAPAAAGDKARPLPPAGAAFDLKVFAGVAPLAAQQGPAQPPPCDPMQVDLEANNALWFGSP